MGWYIKVVVLVQVTLVACLLYIGYIAAKEVQNIGLKTIIEKVWHGESKGNN